MYTTPSLATPLIFQPTNAATVDWTTASPAAPSVLTSRRVDTISSTKYYILITERCTSTSFSRNSWEKRPPYSLLRPHARSQVRAVK